MFLEQLQSDEQRKAFAQLAYLVARADGSLSLADMTLIDLFGVEAVFPLSVAEEKAKEVSDLCAVFAEPTLKEIIYTHLLSFSFTEKYESKNQQKLLNKIREALGIKQSEENRFRSWMKIMQGTYFPAFSD